MTLNKKISMPNEFGVNNTAESPVPISNADIATMKLKIDTMQADTALIKAAVTLPTVVEDWSDNTNVTPSTPDTITFGATSKSIYLRNDDPQESVLVSFDGGATYSTLASDAFIELKISRASIMIQSTAASVPFTCIVGE